MTEETEVGEVEAVAGTIITITREATKTDTEIMKTIEGIEDIMEMKTTVDITRGTDIS